MPYYFLDIHSLVDHIPMNPHFTGHFRNRLIGGSYLKAYFSGLCQGISLENMARNMVQHLRIMF